MDDIEDSCETSPKHSSSPDIILDKIVKELLLHQHSIQNEKELEAKMHLWGRRLKKIVSKNQIRIHYESHRERFKSPMNRRLAQLLVKRAVRSRSGILNVSVVLPPHRFSCKYDCAFCPKEPGMPRSYLSNEDAVARAKHVDFDAVRQVFSRLDTLKGNGHPLDKIEFRILGGTFSSYPHDVVESFIRDLYYAANVYPQRTRPPKTLAEEIDEQTSFAKIHVVGLGLETRPDAITIQELVRFRNFGCTRVELGVQHTNDDLLRLCRRGHGLKESRRAIQLLKDHGF